MSGPINRQRRVLIGKLLEAWRHEALAGNAAHSVKDMPVSDAPPRYLPIDYAITLGGEIGGHSSLLWIRIYQAEIPDLFPQFRISVRGSAG